MLASPSSSKSRPTPSTSRAVYADHAATTPTRSEVVEAMLPHFTETYGNPSGIHSFAQGARDVISRARETIARFVGAYNAKEITFTSGGTESNSLALEGVLERAQHPGRIITTEIEHAAVYETLKRYEGRGFEVVFAPIDQTGIVKLDELARLLVPDTVLVSMMLVNNEVGTIQPLGEIAQLVRHTRALLHTDAVQAATFMKLDVNELDVDALSFSGHKIYGPKGVGALWVRSDVDLEPRVLGGGQEFGRRSGTENVPGIVGLARAVELVEYDRAQETARLTDLSKELMSRLLTEIDDISLTGHPDRRHPGIVSFVIGGVEGESLLPQLDRRKVAASTGSACSTRTQKSSRILEAMGVPHLRARGGLRISLGRQSTRADIEHIIRAVAEAVEVVRNA